MYRYIKMIHSYDVKLTSESFSVFRRPIFRSSRWVWACNSAILFCKCRSFSSEDLRFYKQKHKQFNKSEQSYKLGHHLINEKTSSYKCTGTWIYPPWLNISVVSLVSKKKIKVNSLDCHYCINLPGPSFMYESNLSIATLLL